jgi:hypothetical protein
VSRSVPQRGVGLLRGGDAGCIRLAADRDEAGDLIVLDDWCDVGPHPVESAAFAAILDQPVPWTAGLDGGPEVGESLLRHMRVADDVMRGADQLLLRKTADLDKDVIGEGDPALDVGSRHQRLFGKFDFVVRDRLVHTHRGSRQTVVGPGTRVARAGAFGGRRSWLG